MAQLPPKIPNMAPSWPDFSPHQKMPSIASLPPNVATNDNVTSTTAATAHQNPSWIDEFLDFSSARRGAHRRSVSDSITFLEARMLEDCRGNSGMPSRPGEFDRFDDEQFMSMFNDDMSRAAMPPTLSSSNPSSPSDHNSINDEKETSNRPQKENKETEEKQLTVLKNESDEVESQCKQETQAANNTTTTNYCSDKITDPKRVKR